MERSPLLSWVLLPWKPVRGECLLAAELQTLKRWESQVEAEWRLCCTARGPRPGWPTL